MKKSFQSLIFTVLTLAMCFSSCKQKEDPTVGFSERIRNFVPQEVIDQLRDNGMSINEGKVPPNFEGNYLINNYTVKGTSMTDDVVGTVISNYKIRFYNQDNRALTISHDYKSQSLSDQASGVGAFVAGNGDRFTAFVEVEGYNGDGRYKAIDIYSGEITTQGIRNLQEAFIVTEVNGSKKNQYRILVDADGMSERTNSYRIGVDSAVNNSEITKLKL